ncbi:MAG: leucine-rich repeat domain-containing protein, partial [Clostridia bacterium]|nr:leucine-rich repeat domain-containing protein [Clostridia bacterium]
VTEIGNDAFANMPIKSVVFPDSIKVIDEWSFCDNPQLESVTFGKSVTLIGNSAFSECSSLKSIVIPDSVETIDTAAFSCCLNLETVTVGLGLKAISQEAFGWTNLKSIDIPSNVETIGKNAFTNCTQLEEVVIEDGVKRIEQNAFADCKKLKKVILPNTLEYMEADVFENSPAIECNIYKGMKYLGSATNPYFALVGSDGATQLIPHTDTVFYMSEALLNCENIVSVEVGPNVKFIGYRALGGMDALEEITVHSDNAYYYVVNNILFDKSESKPIQACKTSVIPSDGSIAVLDLDIFSYISSIESFYIPKGIKTIRFHFFGMEGLEMVILESDIEHFIVEGNYDECDLKAEDCYAVYYCYTEEQWENVNVEYPFGKAGMMRPTDCHTDAATHYFYSETEPTGEGNYWHYVDGVPTPWENSTSSETEE